MKPAHKKTYDLLKAYSSSYLEEKIYQEKMLQLLETCDDCFLRRCRVGHFTASAVVLNTQKTHVLLMHHTKLDKWMQLGGHCDGDPDVLAVSIKEAQEESGIKAIVPLSAEIFDIDMHLIPPYKEEGAHYHFDIRFLLHAHQDDAVTKNHESKALKWFPKDGINLPQNIASVGRLFEKVKSVDL